MSTALARSGTRKNNKQVMIAARKRWLEKNPDGALQATREWRKRNQGKVREYNKSYQTYNPTRNRQDWLKRYGMTLEQYDSLLTKQNGVCVICQQAPFGRRLSVDHCHASKVVRGLLCITCNTMLGHAKDDIARLESAIQYLKSYTN